MFRAIFCAALCLPSALTAQALQDENLLLSLPPGFALVNSAEDGNGTVLQEFAPSGQTAQDWSTLLTVVIYHQIDGGDPAALHGQIASDLQAACPGGSSAPVGEGVELGTPVHLMFAACPASPVTGGSESFVSKAMAGRDAMYVVQIAWRGGDDAAQIQAWVPLLRDVTVCDTRRADAPCPG